jgi:hypothetical protein
MPYRQRGSSFVSISTFAIVVIAAAAAYQAKHAGSKKRHATFDTLNVQRGIQRYVVEPGKYYAPVGSDAKLARVESLDGNWFAVSNSNGGMYRDCAAQPVEIAIAGKPEMSLYRVRVCGNGRRLSILGK